MSTQPNTLGHQQKYLFDHHNFDVGAIDPDNPPPPTYTQAELDAAKATSFAEGVRQGEQNGQASRDQRVLDLIQKISGAVGTLTAAEASRKTQYQHEVIRLALALFHKMLPILKNHVGQDQMAQTLEETLNTLDPAISVQIEVAPQDLDDLAARLKPLMHQHQGQITLVAGTDLSEHDFRVKWPDGGAWRTPEQTAAALTTALEQLLQSTNPSQDER
jgi:flagellar assembly protein FliH